MPNPVIWFEIITKDPDGLADFYKNAFGWDVTEKMRGASGIDDYVLARPTGEEEPERSINGGIGGLPPNGYQGHLTFYLAADDLEAALQNAEKYGAKRMMGPEKVPDGPEVALFEDPQGHVVGLVKPDVAI